MVDEGKRPKEDIRTGSDYFSRKITPSAAKGANIHTQSKEKQPPIRKLLNCYYTNANSLKNKMTELHHLATKHNYDIIGISETWARSDMLDPEYELRCYFLFRKDGFAGHGGITLYVRRDLRPVICGMFGTDFDDTVVLQK